MDLCIYVIMFWYREHNEIENQKQRKLYEAIKNTDDQQLVIALAEGAKINNNCRNNVLNHCIKSMLNNTNTFNLNLIDILVKNGAKNSIIESENVYVIIIRRLTKYIKLSENQKDAMDNVLKLLNQLVANGLKSNTLALYNAIKTRKTEIIRIMVKATEPLINEEPMINENILLSAIRTYDVEIVRDVIEYYVQCNVKFTRAIILNMAIRTRNINIIRIIMNIGPEKDMSTLNNAIKTHNYLIVKLIFDYGAQINNSQCDYYANSLTHALRSFDPMIVKEIIIRGGKPYLFLNSGLFPFWRVMRLDTLDYTVRENLMNLLMCAGTKIDFRVCDSIVAIKRKSTRSVMESKILDYNSLYNKSYDPDNQNIKKIRFDLIKTMNMLMEWPIPKQTKIDQIDESLNQCIPLECLDIIYEYQHETMVQFIDWTKY